MMEEKNNEALALIDKEMSETTDKKRNGEALEKQDRGIEKDLGNAMKEEVPSHTDIEIDETKTLLNRSRNIDVRKDGEEKMKKYNEILDFFNTSMKPFRAAENKKEKKEIEKVQYISMNEISKKMLETTTQTLDLLDINKKNSQEKN